MGLGEALWMMHRPSLLAIGLKAEDFLKVAPKSMPAAFKFSLLPLAV
jgi:hypothetical protein